MQAMLRRCAIRPSVHRSARELEVATLGWFGTINANPRLFRWIKFADDMLATIKRFCLPTLKTAEMHSKAAKTFEAGH